MAKVLWYIICWNEKIEKYSTNKPMSKWPRYCGTCSNMMFFKYITNLLHFFHTYIWNFFPINFSQSHYPFHKNHLSLFTIMSNKLFISIPTQHWWTFFAFTNASLQKECISTNGNNPPFSFKTIVPFSSLPFSTHLFLHLTSKIPYCTKHIQRWISHQRREFHFVEEMMVHIPRLKTLLYHHLSQVAEIWWEESSILRRRWCIFPISKHYYIIALSQVAKISSKLNYLGLHHATYISSLKALDNKVSILGLY